MTALDRLFEDVSDPKSDLYGAYLGQEEVTELLSPDEDVFSSVKNHLHQCGISSFKTSISRDKIFIAARDFPKWQRTEKPSSVMNAIATISTGNANWDISLPKRKSEARPPRNVGSSDPQSCLADRVEPVCLRKAYGLDGFVAGKNTTRGQAVIVNNYYSPKDLGAFEKEYKLPAQPVVKNVGELKHEADTESTLDIQYIIATGQNIPTTWVYIDGHSETNPFDNWLNWAHSTPDADLPSVHSLSVGISENEFESLIPAMNIDLKALALRGVTVVFAAGDSGYVPNLKYGASSPFVTSVGGVWNGDLGTDPLQVDPISTGGFSSLDLNPIPDYQLDAVAGWLKSSGKRPEGFNSSRRAVPDISAFDAGVYVVQDGGDTPTGGTSASAPIIAGMFATINAALADQGLPPLGFANPFLYQNSDAFLDIVKGDNGGFSAVKGYDPASGLGTFGEKTFKTLLDRAISAHKAALGKRNMSY